MVLEATIYCPDPLQSSHLPLPVMLMWRVLIAKDDPSTHGPNYLQAMLLERQALDWSHLQRRKHLFPLGIPSPKHTVGALVSTGQLLYQRTMAFWSVRTMNVFLALMQQQPRINSRLGPLRSSTPHGLRVFCRQGKRTKIPCGREAGEGLQVAYACHHSHHIPLAGTPHRPTSDEGCRNVFSLWPGRKGTMDFGDHIVVCDPVGEENVSQKAVSQLPRTRSKDLLIEK